MATGPLASPFAEPVDGRRDPSNPYGAPAYEPLIDIQAILRALLSSWKFIAASLAGVLLLAILYLLFAPRTYEATSRVEVTQKASNPLGELASDNSQTSDIRQAEQTMQTQVDLLKTRQMAQTVLNRMAADPKRVEIAKQYQPEDLQDALVVDYPRNTRILPIGFADHSPEVAAMIANEYSTALIDFNLKSQAKTTSYAREYLSKQMEEAKARLEASERELLAYAREAGVLDTREGSQTGQGSSSLVATGLLQLNADYSQAKSNRIQAQQRWEQANRTPLMSLPEVLSNTAIQQLQQQRAQLQAKLNQDRQRYGEGYPEVEQTAANLAEMNRQISTLASSIKASIRDQYETALRQEQALASGVGQAKGQTLEEQDRAVRYNILQRETDTNRELYEGLLQRYKAVSAEAGITNTNIALVAPAFVPIRPASPHKAKILAAAIVLGGILGLGLVFLKHHLGNRVVGPEWVKRVAGLPLLGTLPTVRDGVEPGDAIRSADTAIAEACHSLRTAIELRSRGSVPASLVVTSSKHGEGKSTVALGLAHAFAEAGDRVLLIDGDMRDPKLHTITGASNSRGFSGVLAGKTQLAEAVARPAGIGIDLLPAGPRPESPAALLSPVRVKSVLDAARQSYDRVIIDTPHVNSYADATRLASAADGTVFVLRNDGVGKHDAELALGHLASEHIKVSGAILNMFDAPRLPRIFE